MLSDPTSIWLDSATERLYVANEISNRVLVFNDAGTINGNVAPSRTITGANTLIASPRGICFDRE